MSEFLEKGKASTATYFKNEYRTDKGKKQLNNFLRALLNPDKKWQRESSEWIWWLTSGGYSSPEHFRAKLKEYDCSKTCGLVWNKDFVAYRCRDCGISPCMSICADCFHDGNHDGHDFNMFRSQAGGACDCGDENVMKADGFCSRHGPTACAPLRAPGEMLTMATAIIPSLFVRLVSQLDGLDETNGCYLDVREDTDNLIEFLNQLSESETLRSVVSQAILRKISDVEKEYSFDFTQNQSKDRNKRRKFSHISTKTSGGLSTLVSSTQTQEVLSEANPQRDEASAHEGVEKEVDVMSIDDEEEEEEEDRKTILGFLMDHTTKFEFPPKVVTFLLQLLPNDEYKEMFTQLFCQQYQNIARTLLTTRDIEDLSGRIVHVSVQLFSNKSLAERMVKQQNLLIVIVKVLHDMMRQLVTRYKVGDRETTHLVVSCNRHQVKSHCYWPIISDFINILSHRSIAQMFMHDIELVKKWFAFISYFSGINLNSREFFNHIEFEPTYFHTSFAAELEVSSASMWALVTAASAINDKTCIENLIKGCMAALEKWFDNTDGRQIGSQVTFHIPLHRNLALFISQAISKYGYRLQDVVPVPETLIKLMEYPLRLMSGFCEIRSGCWVRNGPQVNIQTQFYLQCSFCRSMVDLDLFLLQSCAMFLDPDFVISKCLESFKISHWFHYGSLVVSTPPGTDAGAEFSLVEGFLLLILTLVTNRLHLGMTAGEIIRLEIITQLCFSDKTHSQLVDNTPDKPGQPGAPSELEEIIPKVAQYKKPVFESGAMQQGTYVPKGHVWEEEFDPVHSMQRAIQKRAFQLTMDRYTNYLRQNGKANSNNLWPPFKPLKPLDGEFKGLLRLLHSQTLHKLLFFILHKASLDLSSVPEPVLCLTVQLIKLALEVSDADFSQAPQVYTHTTEEDKDTGYLLVSQCVDFLEGHCKDVKGLHQYDDFTSVNIGLLTKHCRNPKTEFNPTTDSPHDVCVILSHALHKVMDPPLFETMVPYMREVLNSTLNNQSTPQEKVSQLQHIQHLLELIPPHRYSLVKKLTQHLIRVAEKDNIPPKNLDIINDDSQPLEISMLLMYLVKYFDWLFRVRTVPAGFPEGFEDIGPFPSGSMKVNISHVITDQPEAMDTTETQQQQIDAEDEIDTSSELFKTLVQEYIGITMSEQDDAVAMMQSCKGNLEMAINMHLEGVSAVEAAQFNQPLPIVGENANHLSETFVSVLVKLRQSLQAGNVINTPRTDKFVGGDGVYYIDNLLSEISKSSTENDSLVKSLMPSMGRHFTHEMRQDSVDNNEVDAAKAEKRRRAKEHQKKVMEEIAAKQKAFFEAAMNSTTGEYGIDTDISKGSCEEFDCVICGQSSASTEDRPIGLVVLLQPTAVLGHRLKTRAGPPRLPLSDQELDYEPVLCRTVTKKRLKTLQKHFNNSSSVLAADVGCDSGVHVQTCGHHLHLDCQQSYLKSLQEQQNTQLHKFLAVDASKGEFICPLCRQLSNGVLPILPANIMPPMSQLNKVEQKSHAEILQELHSSFRKHKQNSWSKLTASSLRFSVLSASVTTLVNSIKRLETDDTKVTPTSCNQKAITDTKFTLAFATARTNLEFQIVEMQRGKRVSNSRKSCFGYLLKALQFQSQSLVDPFYQIWEELTGVTVGGESKHGTSSGNNIPLLLRDAASLLLQLVLSWPCPLTLSHFKGIVQVVYNLVFIQALVSSCSRFRGDEKLAWQEIGRKLQSHSTSSASAVESLLGLVALDLASCKLLVDDCPLGGISQSVWSPHTVELTVQELCLPFLRLASVLSSVCFGTAVSSTPENHQSEVQVLAESLGLFSSTQSQNTPFSCAACLSWSEPAEKLIGQWCSSLNIASKKCETFPKELLPSMSRWSSPSLLHLPAEYNSLFQFYRKQRCRRCKTTPTEPAICLACGAFLCLKGTCPSKCITDDKNECVQHSIECGAGTAVFLILLQSTIFVIRSERLAIWGSLYLDSYGEEDRELRRGKPLFLSQERFEMLQEQWIMHTFDHACKRWGLHSNRL